MDSHAREHSPSPLPQPYLPLLTYQGSGVGLGPLLHQQLGHSVVPAVCGHMQWCQVVQGDVINLGAVLQEQADAVQVVTLCCHVDRRQAVLRPWSGTSGLGWEGDQPSHPAPASLPWPQLWGKRDSLFPRVLEERNPEIPLQDSQESNAEQGAESEMLQPQGRLSPGHPLLRAGPSEA